MSKENSAFTTEDSCPVKEETDKYLDHNSILLGFIKDETPTYQNIDDNNQSYCIENRNVIIKSSYITHESFDIDAINVPEINTENDDRNTGVQNSILVIEDLVKKEIDINDQMLTYLNNDIDNLSVNNSKSNNITIDPLNVCIKIKIEKDDNNTPSYIEGLFNKIEQMSPNCSDIFKENIFEIKTEKDCKNADIENSILKENGYHVKEEIDIKKEIISCPNNGDNNQLYRIENVAMNNKSKKITYGTNIFEIKTDIDYNPNNLKTLKNDYKYVNNSSIIHLESNANLFKNVHGKQCKCDICQKSLTLKAVLKTHMLTHTSKKQHKCNICQKIFTLKGNLNNHMLTHTGEKPHKCNICQKLFTQKGNLNCHMLTHTGEKPHKCNICQKLFTLKINLNTHMLIHTGEKPHKCNICLKLFTQKGSLNIHMLIHTGEKPHKCNICQKLFTYKGNLNSHMLTHTGKRPYNCNICQKLFRHKNNLNTHMFTHSGIIP